MRVKSLFVKCFAFVSMLTVASVILFLFGYVLYRGASVINITFLTEAPKGAVLGEEGGIFPAIVGSLWFTLTAVVVGSLPAVATAICIVFYCNNSRISELLRIFIQCMSGIPSIVLGLFAYSFLVKDLGIGRCILAGGVAQGIMILPFIEVRAEKAFRELPVSLVRSSLTMGCSMGYTVRKVILPACFGEILSGIVLGACYAFGATAPLIFTGAVAYASVPHSVLEPAMALPLHLYLLVAQGATSLKTAYGTAFVMMAIILICNILVTIYARRRYKKWTKS